MTDSAPTPTEVLALFDSTEDVFQPLLNKFRTAETYYDLEFRHKLGLPEEYKDQGVVLPTARDTVDGFADFIDIGNAKVTITRRDETVKGKESAAQLKKFGSGFIYMTNVQGIVSPWRILAKHYPLYGVAIAKTVYSADLWADKPERKKRESEEAYGARVSKWMNEQEGVLPIIMLAVHPMSFRCDVTNNTQMGTQWCGERYSKRLCDIKRKYKGWTNPKGKKESDPKAEVDFIDYWDRDYRCVLVDGEPVLKGDGGVVPHKYGFIPYTIIDAGLGNVDSTGSLAKRFVGINAPVEDVLISQSRDYSMQDIVVMKNGMPGGWLEGENAGMVSAIGTKFGEWTPLPQGVKPIPSVPIMTPDQVIQHFAISGEVLDGHGIPRVMRGQATEGIRSGADRRLAAELAGYRLRYPSEAFKNRTADILNKAARILKNVVQGNVRVFSYTPADEFEDVIDKDKIEEPINYKVTFSPTSEEEEYRKHDDIIRLKQGGVATTEWSREQIPTMNAKDMRKQELKEQLRAMPFYQNGLNMYGETKMREELTKRIGAEALLAGNPPPATAPSSPMGGQPPGGPQMGQQMGGMVPPVTNRPPLNSAQAIQNRLQGMRSQTPMSATQGRAPNAGGSQNHPQR